MRGNKAYLCGPTTDKNPHLGNYKTMYRSIMDFYKLRVLRRCLVRSRRTTGNLMMNFTDIAESVINAAKDRGISLLEHNHRIISDTVLNLRKLGLRPWVLDLRRCSFQHKTLRRFLGLLSRHHGCEQTQEGLWYVPKSWDRSQGFYLWRVGLHLRNQVFGLSLPGWHLQCAALNHRYSQEQFIHYGGSDLESIHHKNEAHLLGITGTRRLQWRRVGSLLIQDLKMSKSKGNVVLINPKARDLCDLLPLLQKGPMGKTSRFSWSQWQRLSRSSSSLVGTPRRVWGLVQLRRYYRNRGLYDSADRVRSIIRSKGYTLQDSPQGLLLYRIRDEKPLLMRSQQLNKFNEG